MTRLVGILVGTALLLLAPASFALAGDCEYACDVSFKSCGSAAHAARRGCLRDCRAAEGGGEGCRVECRVHFASARKECRDEAEGCRAKCEAAPPEGACPKACLASRQECLAALRGAGEAKPCRLDCQAELHRRRATCGSDAACRHAAADELGSCFARCASSARQASETCHGSYDSCLSACPSATPAPEATPASTGP